MQGTHGMASRTTLEVATEVVGSMAGWLLAAAAIVALLALAVRWAWRQVDAIWDDPAEADELASPVDLMWNGPPVKGRRDQESA